MKKEKSARNRTISLSPGEKKIFLPRVAQIFRPCNLAEAAGSIINQDISAAAPLLPRSCVDLMILDPPYNLTKSFNGLKFCRTDSDSYEKRFEEWVNCLAGLLKPDASVYICGDWRSSAAVYRVASRHFVVRNRVTWEREKGRGASKNWKNCAEDIWFCTVSDKYRFYGERVRLKRKVVAPYRDADGAPRDWTPEKNGDFRLTAASNLWTDITVPFWSMPENTVHPTQKPEKLIAKLILASSDAGDVIFDPFLGSGTTAVVAQKLNRQFIGVEIDSDYCCIALKRLSNIKRDASIQGYDDGVFWERNAAMSGRKKKNAPPLASGIFSP